MITMTITARSAARWVMAAAGALILVMAIVVAGAPGQARAQGEALPTMTADRTSGLVEAVSGTAWSTLTAPSACPAGYDPSGIIKGELYLITGPDNRTKDGNSRMASFTQRDATPSVNLTGNGVFERDPGSYELVMFCWENETPAPPEPRAYVAAFSAWLTFDEINWTITAEEPSADPTSVSLEATADGEPTDEVEVGTDVEVTATVEPDAAAGTVEIFDSNPENQDEPVSLGTAEVSGGEASVTLDDLDAGDYVLTATFTPDDPESFAPSATAAGIPLTVIDPEAVQTTTLLTVTPESPVEVGAEVTLTASVDPVDAAGSVQFKAGDEVLGEPVELANQTAVLTTTELPEGELSLTATFVPDDPEAFSGSTSAPVVYTVGETGPTVTAVDEDGNELDENPMLAVGQKVTLTAPGFQAEEDVTVTVDAEQDGEELGKVAADADGTATVEFTASGLEPGQHQLDFLGATSETALAWQFQIEGEPGDEDGTDDGTEDGTDDGTDAGTDDGTDTGATGDAGAADGGAGAGAGGNPSSTLPLATTGVFVVPAVLLALAAAGTGYSALRRSRREELLTFEDGTQD